MAAVTKLAQVTDRAQGRLVGTAPPVAVIDIGSNSVRLVVYETASRSPAPLFNEKVLCGLGRVVAKKRRIEGEPAERTMAALARFRAIIEQLGAGKPWMLATAAVREAENCDDFVRRAEAITGGKIMLLSGRREAELAAAGIVSGFRRPDGIAADLGGGSLEVIDLTLAGLSEAATLALGGLRLEQRAGGSLSKAETIAEEDIGALDWLPRGKDRTLYAVGGTWRNIARLHMAETGYPLHVTHGYALAADELVAFTDRLAKAKKLLELPGIEQVSPARREVLGLGAIVLKALIQCAKPSRVVFSIFGIREGLLYTLLPREERRQDPLLAFCEDYAVLRSRSPRHAHELCDWTDRLFRAPGPEETGEQRRLRHAACLISDIAWRAHPDYRGEQSLNVIAHAALTGIEHDGRIFLALAVYFRHTGGERNEFSERLVKLVPKSELKRARIIGAAIRAAHMLSVGAPGVIDRAFPHYEGRKLVLTLPKSLSALNGERLQKRFATLADLLDRTPEIRVK
jgi:exopolyphosphatase/guanosine-5'-triphosphate,3'-diphosphate pyrophosphatase